MSLLQKLLPKKVNGGGNTPVTPYRDKPKLIEAIASISLAIRDCKTGS